MLDAPVLSSTTIDVTREKLVTRLLARADEAGYWEGELSCSALSTATAVVALYQADEEAHKPLIYRGLQWLANHANADGGWGDTTLSDSNISTTALCWAAFATWNASDMNFEMAVSGAERWLDEAAGGHDPETISRAILERYAEDRTFSVPILTMLAICGRLGDNGWQHVMALPFELAAAPPQLYRWLRLPVVSYALPALIAIGQVIYYKRGSKNPIARFLRNLTRDRTLKVLEGIQPSNGGFLEAIPLTSFVCMSLAHMGLKSNPVVKNGMSFLKSRIREDGSWPIDTHLATWLTTLAANALEDDLPAHLGARITKWLLDQQYRAVHPFTQAEPGGWAWTPLPGGVPDADDTSGAVLALSHLAPEDGRNAAEAGIQWLMNLQNQDGGIPTFCKGWGRLPFDKSCADITAHALAALWAWRGKGLEHGSWNKAALRMLNYLRHQQRSDGSWVPLWFGNQHHSAQENPVYGTARVLLALGKGSENLRTSEHIMIEPMVQRAQTWLKDQVNPDGSWGGAKGLPGTIEETALAIDALCAFPLKDEERLLVDKGLRWLAETTGEGADTPSAPIGFYFANLWYFESLYPHVFAVSAMQAARKALSR